MKNSIISVLTLLFSITLLISACSSNRTLVSDVNEKSTLTIMLEVPKSTREEREIYITGSFEGWSGGTEKRAQYIARKVSPNVYKVVLTGKPNETIEYKFTQGSWTKSEVTKTGGEAPNRVYTFKNGDETITQIIEAWPATGESVNILSHGMTLAGQLFLPPSGNPKATIVFVHGSGTHRGGAFLAQRLATNGFAALYYDKRGVGDSEGTYVWDENTSYKNLNLLSDDAAAALEIVKRDPRLKDTPKGFFGNSQAGWIIPWAATKSSVDFFALWSGPVCKVSEEHHFSQFAESDPDFWKKHTREEVDEYMKKSPKVNGDVDPVSSLTQLDMPAIWMLGSEDNSIPIDITIKQLDKLQATGKSQFEYRIYEGADHALQVPTLFEDTVAWINGVVENQLSAN